jgi:uncharacterized membrane protein (UPF0127 family)
MTGAVSISAHDDIVASAQLCTSFWCKLRGVMFRRSITDDDCLLMSVGGDAEAVIHTHFVFCPIAVVWLTADGEIIERVLAKPWRIYAPPRGRKPRWILEGPPDMLNRLGAAERLQADVFYSLDKNGAPPALVKRTPYAAQNAWCAVCERVYPIATWVSHGGRCPTPECVGNLDDAWHWRADGALLRDNPAWPQDPEPGDRYSLRE